MTADWTAFREPSATARVRLFCLPYAGGGAGLYRGWPDSFSEAIDVLPIALPGREMRFGEPAFDCLDTLVETMGEALRPLVDRPYVLFGQSMGALIAHRFALWSADAGLPEPVHLFAAAHRAPQVPRRGPALHRLDRTAFLTRIAAYDSPLRPGPEYAELCDLLEPTLRADFAVVETANLPERWRLSCPVTALCAIDDPTVRIVEMAAWDDVTDGDFELLRFEGGHFFVQNRAVEVQTAVAARLAAWI